MLSEADPKFEMLDEAAIAAVPLNRKPYDYAFVDQAIPLKYKDEVLADAPVIPDRGSYGVPNLKYGPKFQTVLNDLATPRFRRLIHAYRLDAHTH